ncbi:hypothetical protein NPIL_161461 [Nephila pilipes]|uniref:Pre-C2HC domain-containing protein n=1 Tax=Nephila pilipes TaxID=299642 RepID=A0A8X6QQ58_NEPPI|nr:hypothetical protein NPIL_161461 [Nephila pilipes]
MPPEQIMEELHELGFQPQTCHVMMNKKTNHPMPLFLTTLAKKLSTRISLTSLSSVLLKPKKEDKKKQATKERLKLRNTLREKRDSRTGPSMARPNIYTAPASYAEAAKSSPATASPTQAPGSISDTFAQLKDPECVQILKKYIALSKSGNSTADRFTKIMAFLEIDNIQ